ncbi:hypothetical protein GH714_011152 [Hevea brasiliensis]|uniref:TLC domain-containing protein n=1 Tax=Hevea brasiliensis TaxID=3981 RepID=A0A6A6KNR9_HEVBR|nr:hypothetical protein GH714_011152 [Hevea brasiliensis]
MTRAEGDQWLWGSKSCPDADEFYVLRPQLRNWFGIETNPSTHSVPSIPILLVGTLFPSSSLVFDVFLNNPSAASLPLLIVYKLTGFLSPLCFKGYDKLTEAEKIEWNNRGFSTFHALIVASASFYLLLLSGLFYEDSQDELIINRKSIVSNSVLGISVGYFLADLSMILWNFPALGGLEYVLHHGLSMYSIFLSLISGQGQMYILMVLFSEATTPFVNLRWYLDVAGRKSSKMYVCNGVLLFLGWLVQSKIPNS